MNVDDTLNQAFEALSGRLRAELQTAADEITTALQAERDRETAAAPVTRTPAAGTGDHTLEGVRSIGAAGSLSEVLDTLAGCAAHEASRAAVLLVRGARLHGWRFVGFPPSFDTGSGVDIALSDAGPIADAVRDGAAVPGTVAPRFADLPVGRLCVAVPIVVGGQAVAVLYVDNSELKAQNSEPRDGWERRVEVLARFASRCLEVITAFRTAALAHGAQPGHRASAGAHDQHLEAGEPGDGDAAARRYARLLVSEIKLYHEPDVIAGRRERDLGTRLGAEIARARLLYEQRVPPQIGRRADYFHAELVRTLADGDAALLELA